MLFQYPYPLLIFKNYAKLGSPATSLSSLSAAAASLRPSAASSHALTPSLASHYRPDLISHVTGWPAELLEKQVNCSKQTKLSACVSKLLFVFQGD